MRTLWIFFLILTFTPVSTILDVVNVANAGEDQLKFGMIPLRSPKQMFETFSPIAKKIEEKTGKKVKLLTAPSFDVYMERACKGEYDVVNLCNMCYLNDFNRSKYKVVAMGTPSFRGILIVKQDSDINDISMLEGKSIAAQAPHSYGGYQFLKTRLDEKNIKANFSFLGKLDKIIYAVINNKYDAGVILNKVLKSPHLEPLVGKLRIVDTSEEIPQPPFVVNKGMSKELTDNVAAALSSVNNKDPKMQKTLKALKIKSIIPAGEEDFNKIIGLLEPFKGAKKWNAPACYAE